MGDIIDEINVLIRNERSSRSKLKEIQKDFYDNVEMELKKLKNELRIASEKGDLEYITMIMGKIKSVENSLKELKSLRFKKIAIMAIEDAFSNVKQNLEGLTSEEKILYMDLREKFDYYLNHKPKEEKVEEKVEEKKEKVEEKERLRVVRMLVSMELADFNRDLILNREDIVTLSERLAEALEKKGLAQIMKENQ